MARSSFRQFWARVLHPFRSRKTSASAPKSDARRSPLQVEHLEDRLAPATDLFTNSLGGAWALGSNWSLNAPPTSAQDATVTPGSTVTVTHASGTDTVHTLTSDGSLLVSGGSLSVTGDIDGTVNVSGSGQLNLSGTGSTDGNVTIDLSSGATVNLSGSLNNTGRTLTISGSGTVDLSGTLTGGTLDLTNGAMLVGQSGTLDNVTLNGGLKVSGNHGLNVKDGLTLNGTATLGDSTGWGYLEFTNSETLGGSGTVMFGSTSQYNTLWVAGTGTTLTIAPTITVHGQSGDIGYSAYYGGNYGSVINQGTIQADISGGTITINGNGVINQGTIQADVSGGTITISGTGDQNTGTLNALNGGTVSLVSALTNMATVSVDATSVLSFSSTLSGGTITTQTGAQISGGTFSGVTVNGNWQVVGDNSLTVQNGLTLNGTLSLGNASSVGYLNFSGSQTLGGTATVVFGSATYSPYYTYYNGLFVANASTTLTIGSNVTVHGKLGTIGYSNYQGSSSGSIINQGTIQADVSGGTITINGTGDQNTGTLSALNGATLAIQSALTNTATISVDASSVLTLSSILSGGTITTQTGAQITGNTLNGVTVDGNWQVIGNNSVTIQNGLTLNGTLSLGNSSTVGYLNFSGSQTLGGTGTVVFGSATYSPYYTYYNGLFVANASTTLTIGPNVTVRGKLGAIGYSYETQGASGGSLINQGTIQADVSGGTITINGTGDQNVGSLNALNGSTLTLQGNGWANSGVNYADATSSFSLIGSFINSGTNLALSGPGSFSVSGGTIQGGTVSVAAGTLFGVSSGTFSGVTVNGNWQVVGDNSLTVQNGLTLNGTLSLGNASSVGYLNFSGSQTLGGTATVVFGSATYSPYYTYYNGLFVANASTTLTIGSNVTVHGKLGTIGYSNYQGSSSGSIINQGTIQADVSGGTITINGTGDQNTGTLSALNGATLAIQSALTNTATISVDASSVLTLSSILSGGTITTQTGAQITGNTLNGVTVDGNWQVIGNNSVTIQNGLTLNGTLSLGNSSTVGYLNFSGSQTLGGTGTVVFGSATYSPYYTYYNGLFVANANTTLTIGPNVTVRGKLGTLGYSNYQGSSSGSIINQGTIQADVSGGTITINATGDQNNGTLNALNGATLAIQSALTNSATLFVDATSVLSSSTLSGGTITTQTGAQITGGTLDGVTIDGNWQVIGDNSVTVKDGLTLNGTLSLGNSSTVGYLNFSGSQTLGGTGTVVFGIATSSPYYYAYYNGLFVANSSTTLTIGSNVTVRGKLGILGYSYYQGSSTGSIINQGTIDADVNGGTITINGTGDQNVGTLNALNGSTFAIQSALTNTAAISVDATSVLAISSILSGGTITTQTGAQITGNTLNGVTVDGNWQVIGDNSLTVQNGLTLNGTLSLGNTTTVGYLNFSGTQTLGGTGTVVFGSSTYNPNYTYNNGLFVTTSGTTLTLGPNVIVRGKVGAIGYSYPYEGSSSGSVINQGTIQADVSGGAITINGTDNQNVGATNALNGATLAIQNALTNTATISVDATSLLSFSTLIGGTITTQTGAQITGSTLDGVTVNGNWQVVADNSLTVKDGLTLNGTLSLGNSTTIGYLNFSGTQTLGGAGTINFGSAWLIYASTGYTSYNGLFVATSGTTITIGPNVTVRGNLGVIGYVYPTEGSSGGIVVNQGTIQADVSGGSITINGNGGTFTNSGTVTASLGTISISTGSYGTVNSGTFSVGPTGTLTITGPFTQSASGNFNVVLGGSTSSLYGHAAISGKASLNGTLNVSEANNFSPNSGNVFTILTYSSVTGQFANYTGLTLSGIAALQPAYNTGSATLTTVTNTTVAPDLRVTNLTLNPANPQSSQNVTVNWNDINAGNGSTGASWTDRVVVTDTTTGQTLATADVPYNAATSGNLASNGSAAQSYTFRLPNGPAGVGNLQVSVTTDYYNTIAEYYPGNVGETNNTTTITAASTLASYPDLQVSGLASATSNPLSGQNFTVLWNDANTGQAATAGNWTDRVTIVNSTTGQTLVTASVPYNAANSGNIAAGGTSPQLSYTYRLPDGLAGVGTLQITVTTNVNGDLYEYNASGTASSNNTATVAATSSLSSYADLTVTNVELESPTSPQSGNPVTVGWNDNNIGNAAVSASFSDYVLVQRLNSDNSKTTIASGYVSGNGTLGAGATSQQTFGFSLPDGAAGVGNFLITVTTDSGQTVQEYNSSGNTAYSNNTNTGSFTTTLANYADLSVANIAVQSPASPQSGNLVTVGWNDDNIGNAAVSASFSDYVLVQKVNADSSKTTITSGYVNGNATLAASAASQQTFTFTLPAGATGAGNFLVTVTTDSGQTVKEYDSNGNPAFGNNTSSATFAASVAPYADLTVTNVVLQSPASPQSGNQVTVGWNDNNVGNAAVNASFSDYVLVQKVNSDNSLTTVGSGYVSGNATLAAGAAGQETFAFNLPDGAAGTGTFRVTVTTDSGQTVKEYDSNGNPAYGNNTNTGSFNTTLSNYADLTVVNLAVQTVAPQSGGLVTVGWDDDNVGNAPVGAGFSDSILVQRVNADNSLTSVASGSVGGNSALGAAATSHQTFTFSLPDGAAGVGNFRVTVTADSGQTVKEYDSNGNLAFGNNSANTTATSTLASYPDLTVANLVVQQPTSIQSSTPVTIGWDDDNIGSGAAGASFSDSVLVQRVNADGSLTTVTSGSVVGNSTLAAGTTSHQKYTFTMPDGAAGVGNFRFTVTADAGQSLKEYDTNGNPAFGNNSGSLNVSSTLLSYADLTVANLGVQQPASVQSGGSVTIGWNDSNIGNAAVNAAFADSILVQRINSDNSLSTINSGSVSGNGALAAGSTSPQTYTFTLPDAAAGVGNFLVTVTTDSGQTVKEYDSNGNPAFGNNSASTTATSVLAPYPDLTVANVAVQSPANPQSGNQVTVGWNDNNIGTASVSASFSDSVLVQRINADNSKTFIASGYVTGNASLTAGAASHQIFAFTLPDGAAGTGNFLVTVTTDSGETVKEYDSNGNAAFGNNTNTGSFSATLANYADLTVANVALQSPASPQSGNQVTVGWDDQNTGNGAVSSAFSDYVLVQRLNADNSKTTIASGYVTGNATLAAGAASPRTFAFSLPDGTAGTGNFLVTVTTDSGQTVKEYDNNGNTAFGNNTNTGTFTSTIANYPDLQVTSLAVDSASVLASGGKVVLDWDDANTGNATASKPWYDQVTVVNTTTGQTLASASVYNSAAANSPVAAGSSVPLSYSFQLPNGSAGVGNLAITVTADIYNNVFEYNASGTGETNNSTSLSATSVLAAYPDLVTSNVTAPTSVVPGQQITVGWTLANNGSATANGPWTEQVLLATDAAGDNPTLLGAFLYAGPLTAGQSVSRSATVQVPNATAGNYWLVVSENPLGEVFETNTANNIAVASQPTTISGTLMLALASHSVSDGAGANATTATVTRNTNTSNSLVVTLTNSNPTSASIPQTATIPAGQTSATFAIGTINSGIAVGTQTATLTASATGILSSSDTLTVTDVNVPTLTLVLGSHSIDENASNPATTGTLTRNTPTTNALVVSLVSSAINKLTVPTSVTIPAGQASVTFPVTVVNDHQIDGNATATITAASTGFVSGLDNAVVVDDNIPMLSLTLAQHTVSEAAGYGATSGIVSISSPASQPITIKLTSSDTTAATVPATVVIGAGQLSASFPITAIDDGLDTGDKTAVITANVETNAGVVLTQGSANDSLLLKEADGPALSVSFAASAVNKGSTATATVTRNTLTTAPLVVNLSSSDPTKATVPATVTIPAGQASVSFTVTAIDDHTPDGLQQVQVFASATGLDTGVAQVGITDVDLPDLVVSSVSAPASGYDHGLMTLSWTVKNSGQYPASGSWLDQVYFDPVGGSQSTTPADTVPFNGTVNAGQSYTQADTLVLPSTVGQYLVRVVTDTDQGVEELSFTNNSGVSAQSVNDQASYHVTVGTTVTTASIATPIPLTGVATMTSNGTPAANVPVAVQIMIAGTTRTLTATTDANGHYSVTFQPLQNEAGEYSVAAADPGVTNPAVQAQFEIVGMTASPANATVNVIPNTPLTGQFTLTDLSSTPLTGLTATTKSGPAGLTVQLSVSPTLAGSGQTTLSYTMTATASTASGPVVLQVTSAEGAVLDIPVNVNVVPATPKLVANPGYLKTGMLVGSQALISFTVVNDGGAPSGDLQVLLPSTSYMTLASPATIPSLAPGVSSTVTVQLSPPANLPLEQYTGTLAVSNTQTGVSVPFTFTAITSAVGDVHVLVDDDYTFDVAGAPHVQGATVNLLNPYDNTQIVATGVTDATGAITFSNVPAGPYELQVQATGHSSYQSSYTVVPGITNNDEVFIARQFVSYTWNVVQTTIQDTYQIQLQTEVQTDVPAPVVTITAPSAIPTLQPGQSGTFNVTVTNQGLIAAQGVTLNLPTDAEYTFTALTTTIGVLPAESSVVVPITVTRAAPQAVSISDGGTQVTTKVEVPNPIESHTASTLYVDYSNTGTVAIPAPLLVLTATQNGQAGAFLSLNSSLAGLGYASNTTPAGFSQTVQFLASGTTPGLLEPGESVTVPVYYSGWLASQWSASPVTFSLSELGADNTQTIDWSAVAPGLRPGSISVAAWNAITPNLTAQMGSTWGQYVQTLDNDAAYLNGIGEPTSNLNQLLSFESEKANAAYTAQSLASVTAESLPAPGMNLTFVQSFQQSISGRYTQGILGYGWTTNWNISASTMTNGDVAVDEDGVSEYFSLQPNGSFAPEAGDQGTSLTLSGGADRLVESNGTIYQFNVNGTLAYVQDTHGNRITAGYNTQGQLACLTDSNGAYIHLTYNAQGHLSQLTDSNGQTETYTYDPTSQFLTGYTDLDGTTNYTYVTGTSAAQNNALAEIAYANNTQVYYTYDSQGRLIDQHENGGAEDESISYLTPGGYVTTDGDGNRTTVYFNLYGATAETIDPLGNVTRAYYDSNLNLTQVVQPGGGTISYTYDQNGNILTETDALGLTTTFTYDSHNNLTSYTDAKGNTTRYTYNSINDLLAITYANGTAQEYTYNPLGEATQFVNANGQAIGYTYNAQGLVATESFADGSSYSYTYDVRGNLTSATDAEGNVTGFIYGNASNPNLLTEVDYPNGTWLKFSYNVVGQRTQSVDQTGFTINYTYDALGRLSQLTDGGGTLIVKYAYDNAGNLIQKDMGNGTRTVYTYDGDGNVLSITNYASANGAINSFDGYTYDALGNVLTDTSQDGQWVYAYDADSQLVGAVFTPNSTDPDGLTAQNLQYVYDAAGNRESETVNGVTTIYVVNNVNEYTSSTTNGITTGFQYDADGNLIAQTTGNSTTAYTFNVLNQLTAVNGSGLIACYGYDPLGNRISQTVNGVTTNFQIDPLAMGDLVATFSAVGTLIAHYTYGLGLVSQVDPTGIASYYDFDNVESTVGITNAAGQYVNHYSYLPFGETIDAVGTTPNAFLYGGQFGVMKADSGLYAMKNRNYDPITGRFVQPDPLNIAGGATNLTTYAENNPVLKTDPTGLIASPIGWYNTYSDAKDAYHAGFGDCEQQLEGLGGLIGGGLGELAGEAVGGVVDGAIISAEAVETVTIEVDSFGTATPIVITVDTWINITVIPFVWNAGKELGALGGSLLGGLIGKAIGGVACPCECPPTDPPTPPPDEQGPIYIVGGPCTLEFSGSSYYVCDDNDLFSQFYTPIGVQGRDCSADNVEIALAGLVNGSSGDGGSGGGEGGSSGGGGSGGGGGGGSGGSSSFGGFNATGGSAVPPAIQSTVNCNPVINNLLQQLAQAYSDANDPPIDTNPAVTGTDGVANATGAPGDLTPLSFIATALGNLGLINGQSGNAGLTPANLAQMASTIATFDQTEADLVGIFATASTDGGSLGITGDITLLQQVDARLEAVTTAENTLFGGDANWLDTKQSATLQQWMTTFFEDAEDSSDGGETITSAERTQLLATTLPSTVSTSEASEFLDRWNRTVQYWSQGIYTAAQVPVGQSTDFLDFGAIQTAFNAAVTAEQQSQANGYSDPGAEIQADLTKVQNDLAGLGVCATVKLQINQTATLTRSAFTGTLSLTNSEGTGAMTNVVMNINITDSAGNPANGEFYISNPSYSGAFSVANGNATLPDNSTGTITFTFIPDDSAASSSPTLYRIGGTIGFTDPAGGSVSISVFPSTITVDPQADLQVNYFLQQTVIGDDPSTPQVEPSEPAVLGMLVTNVGGGMANQLSIATAQPTIVQNDKGLLDNVQIIGTQVGTQQETPSLDVNFGNVAPGQTADADFLLLSSLQGSFTDFTASFTHSDALGGLDTSLISSVKTHTLIHAGDFNFAGSTGEMDYLAEDNANVGNLPDTIYFSDGTTAPVNIATNVSSSPASVANTYTVTANVTSGWAYIQLSDPGAGYTLSEVVRSDGTIIPVSDEAWTTDRTISSTGKATVDYELHILDFNSTGTYTVTYVPVQQTAPASSVTALPAFSTGSFKVNWSGTGGSGALSYNIYVSDNGGAFKPWLSASMLTSATYTGVNGHTYGFYSVATDAVGNVQASSSAVQTMTTVDVTPPTSSVAALPAFSPSNFTLSWSGSDGNGSGIATYSVYVSDNGGPFTALLSNTTLTSTAFTGVNGHTYSFSSIATDNVGNVQATPSAAQATTTVSATTTTTVQSSITSSVYGQTVTFAATVNPTTTGVGTPTGQVDFYDATTNADLGQATLQVVSGQEVATISTAALTAVSHTVVANYLGDGTFLSSQDSNDSGNTITQTVTPAALTITATNVTMTYADGTTLNGSTGFTESGLLGSDSISSVSLATNATLSTSGHWNVGTWSITPRNAVGSGLSNYSITYDNAPTGLIVKALALSVSGLTANNKPFDGTATATINNSNDKLVSVISGDAVTLNTSSTANFSSANVGSWTVTGSGFSISGADAADYALSQPTATAQITPASPAFSSLTASQTITAGTSSITLSGMLKAGALAIPQGETVNITIDSLSANVTIGINGSFSTSFSTASLTASGTAYTITYSYAGDGNFNAASDSSTTLTVNSGGPTNVTAQMQVTYGGIFHVAGSRASSAYQFTEALTFTNTSSVAITGPIYLEVSIQGATLANQSGTSASTGLAYILVSSSGLAAGASVSVTLDYYDPTLASILIDITKTTMWAGGPPA